MFFSATYLRREGNSDPANDVDDEKNEQKCSKNAATNIHLISPMIYVELLNVGSVGVVWAVAHLRDAQAGAVCRARECRA
jgi:hypothetical protein